MTPSNRRVFLMQVVSASGALAVASSAHAQAALAENDPLAAAQGYKADASKVDKAKYPKYAAGQNCSNCALYQGAATAAAAPCALFPGKTVAGKGWCNAYAKKA